MKNAFLILFWMILITVPLNAIACHSGGSIGFASSDPGNLTVDLVSSSSYSSGSTSGTSGCENWDFAHHLRQVQSDYLIAEWDHLSEEAALGKGSRVGALAQLMGCSKKDHAFFALFIKTNYASLFAHSTENPKAISQKLLITLETLMAQQNIRNRCDGSTLANS